MSHSTVLVIVEDATSEKDAIKQAEEMLEPFDESMEVDPYAENEVSFEDFKKTFYDEGAFPEEVMLERFNNPTEKDAETLAEELYLNEVRIVDGKFWAYSTYNPKSRWDWYQLGGRWPDMLPNKKTGKGANVVRNGDLDVEGGRDKAIIAANKLYDEFEQLKAGRDPGPSFEDIVESADPTIPESKKYEFARGVYNGNPVVKEASEKFGLYFTSPHEYFKIGKGGRYAFVEEEAKSFIQTFAVLNSEGEWLEKGQMLMFGFTDNQMEQDDWNKIFWEQLNEAPETAWFLVYDVHI